jgi:hypothetical protein
MKWWWMNDELERMCNEAVLALFDALSHNLPGVTEENHKNLSQDIWYPGRDYNSVASLVIYLTTLFFSN